MAGVLKYADRIYVLCTDECGTLVLPEDWGLNLEDKVVMVNGYEFDQCNGVYAALPHWQKAGAHPLNPPAQGP